MTIILHLANPFLSSRTAQTVRSISVLQAVVAAAQDEAGGEAAGAVDGWSNNWPVHTSSEQGPS